MADDLNIINLALTPPQAARAARHLQLRTQMAVAEFYEGTIGSKVVLAANLAREFWGREDRNEFLGRKALNKAITTLGASLAAAVAIAAPPVAFGALVVAGVAAFAIDRIAEKSATDRVQANLACTLSRFRKGLKQQALTVNETSAALRQALLHCRNALAIDDGTAVEPALMSCERAFAEVSRGLAFLTELEQFYGYLIVCTLLAERLVEDRQRAFSAWFPRSLGAFEGRLAVSLADRRHGHDCLLEDCLVIQYRTNDSVVSVQKIDTCARLERAGNLLEAHLKELSTQVSALHSVVIAEDPHPRWKKFLDDIRTRANPTLFQQARARAKAFNYTTKVSEKIGVAGTAIEFAAIPAGPLLELAAPAVKLAEFIVENVAAPAAFLANKFYDSAETDPDGRHTADDVKECVDELRKDVLKADELLNDMQTSFNNLQGLTRTMLSLPADGVYHQCEEIRDQALQAYSAAYWLDQFDSGLKKYMVLLSALTEVVQKSKSGPGLESIRVKRGARHAEIKKFIKDNDSHTQCRGNPQACCYGPSATFVGDTIIEGAPNVFRHDSAHRPYFRE